jgi:hypothetical protein
VFVVGLAGQRNTGKEESPPQPPRTAIRFHGMASKGKSLPLRHRPETTTFGLQINGLAAQWNA